MNRSSIPARPESDVSGPGNIYLFMHITLGIRYDAEIAHGMISRYKEYQSNEMIQSTRHEKCFLPLQLH